MRQKKIEGEFEDYQRKEEFYFFQYKETYLRHFWMYTRFLPLSPTCLLRWAGAKIGEDVFIGGRLLDPDLVEIGDHTTIGIDAIISGHIRDQKRLILKKVRIGKNCLIGGRVEIGPGVVIENNVTVAAGALVLQDSFLPSHSVWADIPAKRIKQS